MNYDLIIFDYDGVVADSEVLNSTVMAEQLTAIGLPTSLDDVLAAYTGKRWRDNRPTVEAALGHLNMIRNGLRRGLMGFGSMAC